MCFFVCKNVYFHSFQMSNEISYSNLKKKTRKLHMITMTSVAIILKQIQNFQNFNVFFCVKMFIFTFFKFHIQFFF